MDIIDANTGLHAGPLKLNPDTGKYEPRPVTLTEEQAAELRKLASGRACPAGTGGILERIAANHAVTRGLVSAYTRTRDESTNFYARLRAAGFQFTDGGGIADPDVGPNVIVTLEAVRPEVQTAARAFADTMDRAAEQVAEADRVYSQALGWAG